MPDEYLAGARVVAAYQSKYEKRSERTPLELVIEAVSEVVLNAGLEPSDVDGLAVASFQLAPDNVVTVAEQLGATLRWAWQGAHGGASGVVSVIQAAEAITLGRARVVVCAAADAFTTSSHNAMVNVFNTGMRDHLAPYGFGGTNGIFAMVEREHRERFGTTREQLGKIAVTQRRYAQRNPNALLRGPLSIEDYLNARVIADPVRLFDCVLPCAGADAVLLVAPDLARELQGASVLVRAGSQRHNHLPAEVLSVTTGAAAYATQLFETAGVSRDELDFVQLYDDYPIMVVVQLEDLGFAEKGDGGRFVDVTSFEPDGDLPLNTGGGQLSCGQAGASGGMIGVYEGVTQLLGQAGSRQLADARLGLVSGFGMVGYAKGLSSATAVFERAA
ncbi:MAG: thiolase family protein [Gaiellaceae bacterium]